MVVRIKYFYFFVMKLHFPGYTGLYCCYAKTNGDMKAQMTNPEGIERKGYIGYNA